MTDNFSLQNYLQEEGVSCQTLSQHPLLSLQAVNDAKDIPGEALARALLLNDGNNHVMTILPATHVLDYAELCRVLAKTLDPLTLDESAQHLCSGIANYVFPLPNFYDVPAIVDSKLMKNETIYIEDPHHDLVLTVSSKDFMTLLGNVHIGDFTIPYDKLTSESIPIGNNQEPISVVSNFMSKRLQQRIEETYEMPIIPDIARQLLELRVDPDASAVELAEIVEMDPSLSAQVISWACSPYYGYSGTVQSVEHAIIRVLGFDLVMNLAVGLAIGKSFEVPLEGPLGLRYYWEAAINSAAMMDKLVRIMPTGVERPAPGLAYLTGLLHNFGHLVLGHVFPQQFKYLNHLVALNPLVSVRQLQYHVFGAGYEELGATLLASWNLPKEVSTAVNYQNDPSYQGDNSSYVALLNISNALLRRSGIGYADCGSVESNMLNQLHLSEPSVLEIYDEVMKDKESLTALSRQMVNT